MRPWCEGKVGQCLGSPRTQELLLFQSYYNASRERYTLLTMPSESRKAPCPEVQVNRHEGLFFRRQGRRDSQPDAPGPLDVQRLRQAGHSLPQPRGFPSSASVPICGKPVRCPNCEVSLTYHLKEKPSCVPLLRVPLSASNALSACGRESLNPMALGPNGWKTELKALYPACGWPGWTGTASGERDTL